MTARTPQQDGAYRLVAADVSAAKARELLSPMLTTCGCGWEFYGGAADGITRVKQHRLVAHPDRVDRGKAARKAAARNAPKTFDLTAGEL